jgi:hypothetical protein
VERPPNCRSLPLIGTAAPCAPEERRLRSASSSASTVSLLPSEALVPDSSRLVSRSMKSCAGTCTTVSSMVLARCVFFCCACVTFSNRSLAVSMYPDCRRRKAIVPVSDRKTTFNQQKEKKRKKFYPYNPPNHLPAGSTDLGLGLPAAPPEPVASLAAPSSALDSSSASRHLEICSFASLFLRSFWE